MVKGHTGAAYNLISAQHFWGEYTLTYIISGALNGYKYGTGTIYEYERLAIYNAGDEFVKSLQQTNELALNLQMEWTSDSYRLIWLLMIVSYVLDYTIVR